MKVEAKKMLKAIGAGACAALISSAASAVLYTSSYGTLLADPSNCDDCASPAVSLGGSINYFGTTYTEFFVSSNGYITFGAGSGSFSTAPINTQDVAPMIAGSFTDLDSRNDALSNVWVNLSTPGEAVITWDQMGHFSRDYSVRSTFQILLRTDAYAATLGGAQIGFYYGSMTDSANTAAGFGDGLIAVNLGEVALASNVPGTTLPAAAGANGSAVFTLTGGTPQQFVPAPLPLGLLLVGGAALAALSRRSKK